MHGTRSSVASSRIASLLAPVVGTEAAGTVTSFFEKSFLSLFNAIETSDLLRSLRAAPEATFGGVGGIDTGSGGGVFSSLLVV